MVHCSHGGSCHHFVSLPDLAWCVKCLHAEVHDTVHFQLLNVRHKVSLSPKNTIGTRHSVCALVVCLKYVIQCSIKMRFEI